MGTYDPRAWFFMDAGYEPPEYDPDYMHDLMKEREQDEA